MYLANFDINQKKAKIMSFITILISILLPPLAVFLKHGLSGEFVISILLTLVGWLPGVIYALYVNSK